MFQPENIDAVCFRFVIFSVDIHRLKIDTRNVLQLDKCPKDNVFLELWPEVKVTVTQKQYATLRDQTMYPRTIFGIPT